MKNTLTIELTAEELGFIQDSIAEIVNNYNEDGEIKLFDNTHTMHTVNNLACKVGPEDTHQRKLTDEKASIEVEMGTYGNSKHECIWFHESATNTGKFMLTHELDPKVLLAELKSYQDCHFKIVFK